MVSYDNRRANGRDALVTLPPSDLRQGVCFLRGQPPQATPRCGSLLHGGPRVLRSMRLAEPAPRAGAKVESWTSREGEASQRTLPGVTGSSDVNFRVSLPARETNVMGGTGLSSDLPTPD
jgi:hypothetical protein